MLRILGYVGPYQPWSKLLSWVVEVEGQYMEFEPLVIGLLGFVFRSLDLRTLKHCGPAKVWAPCAHPTSHESPAWSSRQS